ncbi:MAG: cytochrome P460 family protein [Cyanobacteria bacterium J06638_22]
MQRQWIRLLMIFLVAIGVAIAGANLLASSPNIDYSTGYQTTDSTSTTASLVEFPADYGQQFFQYTTVDCPNSRIVRKMFVNQESLEAIATSQIVPSGTVIVMETHSAQKGDGGQLVPSQLNNVFIREKRTGWSVHPDSGEWQSAWYSPSGSRVSSGQSSCISCHTGVRDRDYVFTLPALISAAQTGQLQRQQTEFGTSVCR